MDQKELAILSEKYLAGTASEAETDRLLQWYNAYDEQELTVHIQAAAAETESSLQARMYQRLHQATHPAARKPVLRMRDWYGKAAAAVLILLMAGGGYYFFTRPRKSVPLAAAAPSTVQPGSNKATLTLADGTVINLDSIGTGPVELQGVKAVKTQQGQIVYKDNGNAAVHNNVLRTPRGGQFRVTLPDGTNVWLNAASSISYPTAFTGKSRNVSVTGEAYFEVAADAVRPFEVTMNDISILVLGTHFNINAYEDEPTINTTLLEGAVLVKTPGAMKHLEPGQQARVKPGSDRIEWLKHADVNSSIAWKNGYFSFDDADIPTVMRQLARWYNIEVSYAGNVPEGTFTGEIGRNLTQSQLMKILTQARINYKQEEGRKLVIYP
ncbi:FecR family protein [Chitinophaga qingshengii]|uniref:FecR domain-containing protein n=1 Tax=Chitinophaga qingshengii TaxID=1569794 RepID=A0ABR7TKI7_9BACT|nr:FecR family protein [Chitinophaga qingshengii]MBC9930041.1 FecR domain-containing protein [Chitinophaga qingshengii]